MTSKAALSIVCDAGPLIHLDELKVVWLLNDFQQVLIPEQVWAEVAVHRPDMLESLALVYRRIQVEITEAATFQALVQMFSLDRGEQAALSLMQLHPDAIFLTDDAAARLAAMTLGVRVHGTIGILLRAIRRQQLSRAEVIEVLQGLPRQSTLHVKASLLEEVMTRLREEAG